MFAYIFECNSLYFFSGLSVGPLCTIIKMSSIKVLNKQFSQKNDKNKELPLAIILSHIMKNWSL